MSVVRLVEVLRSPRRVFSGQGGFSLIEVMAALFIFALLTLGLVPLLTSSIRGSNTARADTIGKNAALKAMERVRGLPFYVSYATSTTRVDLLDLYYPDAATDVVVGGRTMYRIICPSNALSNPACPRDVPEDYTITFEAQFVDPVATGPQPTPGETATSYANVDPASVNPNYSWSSATTDSPPRQIVLMSVIASWTVGGQPESYTLTSLLSDRNFGGRKIKATASVGYGANIFTAYDSRPGGGTRLSSGNVTVLAAESDIEGRRLSTARQSTTSVRAEIQQENGGSLGSAVGARSDLQAPPDQNPGTTSSPSRSFGHPEFSNQPVAQYGASSVVTPRALAASAAPSAVGDAAISGPFAGSTYVAIRDPQLGPQDLNQLKLATQAPLIDFVANNGLPGPLPGVTSPAYGANSFVVGGSRTTTLPSAVQAQATIGIDRIYLLDSNWPELSDTEAVTDGSTLTGFGHLIVIDDFRASVTCSSASDGTGTHEARFRGTLYFWEDPQLNSNRDDARYRRVAFDVTSSTSGPDPLALIKEEDPLVYDHPSANSRAYLFGTAGAGGRVAQLGYLNNWNSLTTTASRVDTSTDAAGEPVASANSTIDGAIEIETADLDFDRRDVSALTLSLGSLSCFAEDAR